MKQFYTLKTIYGSDWCSHCGDRGFGQKSLKLIVNIKIELQDSVLITAHDVQRVWDFYSKPLSPIKKYQAFCFQ